MVKYNVAITKLSHPETLCNISHNLVIFPERVQYPVAKKICTIHGGRLAVPRSEMDNKVFMDIVGKHKRSCIDGDGSETENLVWIGAEKFDKIWYELSTDRIEPTYNSSQPPLIFQKFLHTTSRLRADCAYLGRDGYWDAGYDDLCKIYLSLCTICSIYGQPVFTVKGTCENSFLDWNYYPVIDSRNQIKVYEAFKQKSTIYYDEKFDNW